ncbi:RHS repeat-associated core domain-containing protein [Aeromonas hydrophila]|uniref:RHS repeat-associated core domain-containing protein n=1 Tax=Aeromonas hydrophila TaxID=644 RepID=UPI0038CF3F06
MNNSNEKYRDAEPPNIARRTFILRASVLTTSAALLTLSPAGRALAGWAAGPGEMPEVVGRMLLQENSLAFNGERRDPVTGLYHLGQGYRAYNPGLMRFHVADSLSPFGEGGINPYAYCLGDPVNLVDPTGHISWQAGVSIGMGILAILIGIVTLGAGIGASMGLATGAVAMSAAAVAQAALAVTSSVLGVVSGVLSIASGAVEESNPAVSAQLGWAALGVGVFSALTGIGSAVASAKAVAQAAHAAPAWSFTSRVGQVSGGQLVSLAKGGVVPSHFAGALRGVTEAKAFMVTGGGGLFKGGIFSTAQQVANQSGKILLSNAVTGAKVTKPMAWLGRSLLDTQRMTMFNGSSALGLVIGPSASRR